MQPVSSETVQPSLWDRLIDDLPGLTTDIAAMRGALRGRLGTSSEIDALISDGLNSLRRRTDLTGEVREIAEKLILATERQQRLENQGNTVGTDDIRRAVRRDIEMLFNCEHFAATYLLTEKEAAVHTSPDDLLANFPEVQKSVLNYGMPSFSGRRGSDFDRPELEAEITAVLKRFEPRLKPNSIKVKVTLSDTAGLRVEIDAILMLSPVSERLRFTTTIDLDNGQAETALEAV